MNLPEGPISRLAGPDRPQRFEEFTFENLENTDRIVVTTNLNQKISEIDDPETIRAVLNLIKNYKSGWTVPRRGVPVAKLRLNFYTADRPLGNVGVGNSFLTTHQFGNFWSKTCDEAARSRLLETIGL